MGLRHASAQPSCAYAARIADRSVMTGLSPGQIEWGRLWPKLDQSERGIATIAPIAALAGIAAVTCIAALAARL